MKIEKIPVRVSIVMLLLSIPPMWPYVFYTLLRLVVCGTSIYLAYFSKSTHLKGWMWTFIFIALLFNPFLPVHLSKGLWVVIDLFVAILFSVLISNKRE